MPSLFRRKPADLVEDSVAQVTPAEAPEVRRPKGYTPSKKELGVATPKRSDPRRRTVEPQTPKDRKEAARQLRERRRAERLEAQAGMRRGEERYLLARDRGPERALARDIVDSRRTVGTWFFGGALIVLLGSSAAMPPIVRLVANLLWALLALAVVIDSALIARRIGKLVRQRFPQTTERFGSLYFYGIVRGLTFRKMRMPNPRVAIGDKI